MGQDLTTFSLARLLKLPDKVIVTSTLMRFTCLVQSHLLINDWLNSDKDLESLTLSWKWGSRSLMGQEVRQLCRDSTFQRKRQGRYKGKQSTKRGTHRKIRERIIERKAQTWETFKSMFLREYLLMCIGFSFISITQAFLSWFNQCLVFV